MKTMNCLIVAICVCFFSSAAFAHDQKLLIWTTSSSSIHYSSFSAFSQVFNNVF